VTERIILDCDPGLDDAIALALALRHADVVGITTVGGNVEVEHTTTNALAFCELLGRSDVPVHAGHDEPLAGRRVQRAVDYHGPRGTGDVELPPPHRGPDSTDAVGWLVETVRAAPGAWLVATGPLTNIGRALQVAPDLVDHVAGISWMGGSSTHGNTTPAAEFNCFADPEAAAVVFGAGHPNLSMAGLNLTLQVLLDRPWIDDLAARLAGRPAAAFTRLLAYYEERTRARSTLPGTPVHDALAVLRVTHPGLLAGRRRPVEIVTEGAARGMTLVDTRPNRPTAPGNCLVLEWADDASIRDVIAAALVAV
jgi:inosine-uridine nucleoside N-ribohydrolase